MKAEKRSEKGQNPFSFVKPQPTMAMASLAVCVRGYFISAAFLSDLSLNRAFVDAFMN